jgi:hypothetical protein
MIMNVLQKELHLISSRHLRQAAQLMLDDYGKQLAAQPSSSTGKYHPSDERGRGGKLLHIRRVVWGAQAVAKQFSLSKIERDCMITAALFHDIGTVRTETGGQLSIHADISAGIFASFISKVIDPYLLWKEINLVQRLIRTHGGIWYPFHQRPKSKLEILFSALDYIVSRLSVKIDPEGEC